MRPRFLVTSALMLAVIGAISWFTMPRREDPKMPDLWSLVEVAFPGADASTMERMVVDPIEDHLAEVEEIYRVTTEIRNGYAVFELELFGGTKRIERAWDKVQDALDRASVDFPSDVLPIAFDREMNHLDSIVLVVTGSDDPSELRRAARRMREALLFLPSVAKVNLIGDPGDQVRIEVDDAAARRMGIDLPSLAGSLSARNRVRSGGTVRYEEKNIALRPMSEFTSIEEIRSTPVMLRSGATVPLSSFARVIRGPEEPVSSLVHFEGRPAVALGVVPREGVDTVAFGRAIRAEVQRTEPSIGPLSIHEMAFQPHWVERRISGLQTALVVGILIVAAIVIAVMGVRLGLVVASIVPLVALASLAIWALLGGVLHQMSIAALVIALGMLVDNAIVVAENIQSRVDRGTSRFDAARQAVRELRVPLAAATGTTMAAFLPMLAAEGATAAFTRSIPLIVMLTLAMSYLYAILVTPVFSKLAIKSGTKVGRRPSSGVAVSLGALAVRHPAWVLLLAVMAVGLSASGMSRVKRQFFPASDRNKVIVDLRLPDGTHLGATHDAVTALEGAFADAPGVASISSFIGRGVPSFYYNLPRISHAPHFAQVVMTTDGIESIDGVIAGLRSWTRSHLPDVEVVARRIQQGPPIAAPIEVRLLGESAGDLEAAADMVLAALRDVPGVEDARHDAGIGVPTIKFQIDDARAARRAVTRDDVAVALYGATRGNVIGYYRADDDPVPVVLRSPEGEHYPVAEVEGISVGSRGGRPIPVAEVASMAVQWRPAVIRHFDRKRIATVRSEVSEGIGYAQVLERFEPILETLPLPEGVEVRFGGDAEGSGDANTAMMRTIPLGLVVLLGILLAEFNSFRLVALVLVTVPLAIAGIVPGLLYADQPFGFMSFLGVIALVGVVVNNAIVLLDLVERLRMEGSEIHQALGEAVARRMRPILLTTATTVAGLLPLALSDSSLWPPMAWTMISGLVASTFLTLLVVPSLYLLLFQPREVLLPRRGTAAWSGVAAGMISLLIISFAFVSKPAMAQTTAEETMAVTLREAIAKSRERPEYHAVRLRAEAARDMAIAERRAAYLPSLSASVGVSGISPAKVLETPIGDFVFTNTRLESLGVSLRQPVFDPVRMLYTSKAARRDAEAEQAFSLRADQLNAREASAAFLEVSKIDAAMVSTRIFIAALKERLRETDAKVEEGSALGVQTMKVRLALDSAKQELHALEQMRAVATRRLGASVGVDAPVEARPISIAFLPRSPDTEQLVEIALRSRFDLRGLELEVEAASLRRSAVKAELIPKVEAGLSWSRTTGSVLDEQGWWEWGASLVWRPLASATRFRRASAAGREAQARQKDFEATRRTVKVEVVSALSEVEIARSAYRVAERGVELAREALRVERARYEAGRVTVNDLLEAEASLREQSTRRDIARLDFIDAWIRLNLAVGRQSGDEILDGLPLAS